MSTDTSAGHVLSFDENEVSFVVPESSLPACRAGIEILLNGEPAARAYPASLNFEKLVDSGVPSCAITFRFPPSTFRRGAARRAMSLKRVSDDVMLDGGGIFPKTTKRKPRILVFIPSGAIWKHGSVELSQSEWDVLVGQYFNVGDMMVYDSTLKLLEYDNLDVARITNYSEDDVRRYNSDFDYCFLRGSNYIHEHMQWEGAKKLLDRLQLPVYAIGVGAQAETTRKLNLSQESISIWKLIAERSGAIGVRGQYSAECLNDIGIKNVSVVGCPSLFRARDQYRSVTAKPMREIRKIAFSLRREVNTVYSANPADYLAIQRETMLRLADESEMTVTIHGEPEEKAFFFKDRDRMEAATKALTASGWLTPETREAILRIYRNQLYMYTRADDYDQFIQGMDFAFGYRVHGILPALANGVPGAIVNYDTRSAELAKTHAIPLVEEKDLKDRSWRDIYSSLNFAPYNAAFRAGYDRMKGFLTMNGIPTTM